MTSPSESSIQFAMAALGSSSASSSSSVSSLSTAPSFPPSLDDFKVRDRPPQRKSLKLAGKKTNSRFPAPTSSSDREKVCEGFTPKSTQRSTEWAVRVFDTWRKERNKKCAEKCPGDLFDRPTLPLLNKWLSAFVVEARREDGGR